MSHMSNREIECPECGKFQKVTVWDSINVDLDAALRERLFAREINQFQCSSCGHNAFLDFPLLYHDMTRQFLVQYFPPSYLDKGLDVTGRLDASRWQVVFDMTEMLRYILFRETLDS